MSFLPPNARTTALTCLTRLAQRRGEQAEGLIDAALGRRSASAPDALEVAIETGDPIGRQLAEELRTWTDLECIESVAEKCAHEPYVSSLYLREVAWVTTSKVVEARLADTPDTPPSGDLALWLERHGRIASQVGEPEKAVVSSQRAVDLWRRLSEGRPWKYRPDLARGLNNLALVLRDANLPDQALRSSQREVELYRKLVEASQEYLPRLGGAYSTLSLCLRDVGRLEEALGAVKAAAEIEHQLGQVDGLRFRLGLAANLNNLATLLREAGKLDEALEAARESIGVYRELTGERPDQAAPELSLALNNLGMIHSDLAQQEEAVATMRKAVDLDRELAKARPSAFDPQLAHSLINLGKALSEIGESSEAWWATREAVDRYRQLAERRPELFRVDLARALNNFANRWVDLAEIPQAREAAIEAIELQRVYASEMASGEHDLAVTLLNLARIHWAAENTNEALCAAREAVDLFHQLGPSEAFHHGHAMAVSNLGAMLQQVGQSERALEPLREAINLRRRLLENQPNVAPELAMTLGAFAFAQRDLGHPQQALAAVEEALRTLAPSYDAYPEGFLELMQGLLSFYLNLASDEGLELDQQLVDSLT